MKFMFATDRRRERAIGRDEKSFEEEFEVWVGIFYYLAVMKGQRAPTEIESAFILHAKNLGGECYGSQWHRQERSDTLIAKCKITSKSIA